MPGFGVAVGAAKRSSQAISASGRSGSRRQATTKATAGERLMPAQQWTTRGEAAPQRSTKARRASTWAAAGATSPGRAAAMSLNGNTM